MTYFCSVIKSIRPIIFFASSVKNSPKRTWWNRRREN